MLDYVNRMDPDQPGIYYITADTIAAARNSPHLEGLKKRGYEVLYMADPVDEWVGTRVVFDLRENEDGGTDVAFTHDGLVPSMACWEACNAGWDMPAMPRARPPWTMRRNAD